MINFNKKQLNRKREIKERKAFSLIEIIVSVSIFTIILLSMTSIFKMVIDAQRKAIISQNVQESLKYFLEVINKEIRMAQRSDGGCFVEDGHIFDVEDFGDSSSLSFKNRYGECVKYYLEKGDEDRPSRFRITRNNIDDYISPDKINIDSLNFLLQQCSDVTNCDTQDLVTINIKASGTNSESSDPEMIIQTSLSSRYYLKYKKP